MTTKTEIVGYIPPQLYQRVEQFREQQGLNSIADAVNLILEEYFRLDRCQTTTSETHMIMVEGLKDEVSDLKRQVSQLQQNFASEVTNLKRQVSQLQQNSNSDRPDRSSNTDGQSDLLDRQQLAERLGVDQTAIAQHETDGKEFVEWSKSKDPEQISWKYAGANLFRRV